MLSGKENFELHDFAFITFVLQIWYKDASVENIGYRIEYKLLRNILASVILK